MIYFMRHFVFTLHKIQNKCETIKTKYKKVIKFLNFKEHTTNFYYLVDRPFLTSIT